MRVAPPFGPHGKTNGIRAFLGVKRLEGQYSPRMERRDDAEDTNSEAPRSPKSGAPLTWGIARMPKALRPPQLGVRAQGWGATPESCSTTWTAEQ